MIVHDIEQGSKQWYALRLGIPTVSRFGRILQAKKLGYSAGAQPFIAELLAEKILGRPVDEKELSTPWTGRGTELEVAARRWYEMYRDVDVQEVGFITTDLGGIGGSPDGLVGDDGGVEIKCRGAKAHMACVLGIDHIADPLQVQGYLWLTGRKWWDVVAYNPELPKRIERRLPVPAMQEAITENLDQFLTEFKVAEEKLAGFGDVIEDDGIMQKLAASVKAAKS